MWQLDRNRSKTAPQGLRLNRGNENAGLENDGPNTQDWRNDGLRKIHRAFSTACTTEEATKCMQTCNQSSTINETVQLKVIEVARSDDVK